MWRRAYGANVTEVTNCVVPGRLILVALLLAACQAAPPTTTPGFETPIATAGESPGATGEGTNGPAASAGLPYGDGDFVLADPLAGLDGLTSHRATLTESFEGETGGQARAWTVTTSLVVATSPLRGLRTVEASDDLDPEVIAAINGWSAIRDGAAYAPAGGTCSATLVDAATGDTEPGSLAEPAAGIGALLGASPAGHQTIDGTEVDAYAFDQRALGFLGTATATGTVSVATAGGYIVRYEVVTTGGPDYFGEGTSGTLTTRYALTDVNAEVAVDLPADCPPGAITLLVPTDATDVESRPGLLRYATSVGVKKAAETVRGNAVIAHWTADGQPLIGETAAHLWFVDGLVHLDAVIRRSDGRTVVEILGTWGPP